MDVDKQNLGNELISEVRRRLFDESVPRLKKCLEQLSEAEIWHRPNENTVSAGNLVLHLCGNLRQWILTALGDAPDIRIRDKEFDEKGPIPTEKLIADLDQTMAEVGSVLDSIRPEALLEKYTVQGFEETGLSILIHVTEHFSYHVGQITYIVKSNKNIDLKYYEGVELENAG